jgi:OOP family OmpA-OmpF porin
MTRTACRCAAALALAAFVAAPIAAAQPGAVPWGNYVGASAGDSDYDTGFKLFFGQQFHPNVAWEAQYVDFGDRSQGPGGSVRASASSLGGSVVGLLPLSPQFTLFGKLGAHYTRQKFSRPTGSSSDTGFELGAGAGLTFQVMPQLSLRVEIESIGDPGDLISIGAQLRF